MTMIITSNVCDSSLLTALQTPSAAFFAGYVGPPVVAYWPDNSCTAS